MFAWPPFPTNLRLQPADLNRINSSYGVATVIRRGLNAASVDPETLQPNRTHPDADGWGFLYPADMETSIQVEWSGHSSRQSKERSGSIPIGSQRVTWSGLDLGVGDIFVCPFEEAVITDEVLIRGVLDPSGNSLERLRHRFVTGVDLIRTVDRDFTQGVDWQLGADGQTIEWLGGGEAPETNTSYGVRYRCRSQYVIAVDEPQQRNDGEALLYTALVQRFASVSRQAENTTGAM